MTKVAETDAIVVNQPMEKRMNWDAESTDEVIFKNNKFIGMGMGKFSPTARRHPTVALSGISSTTKLLSANSSLTDHTHSLA